MLSSCTPHTLVMWSAEEQEQEQEEEEEVVEEEACHPSVPGPLLNKVGQQETAAAWPTFSLSQHL